MKWKTPQARMIAATVGDVRVVSVYVPNGQAVGSPAYQYKMEWYRRLASCLREKEGALERVVVCGDFNVAPNDEDVHDPALWRGAIMCSDEERAAFHALCELGLADTLRLHHPETGHFQLVGLPDARLSEESRAADRRHPRRERAGGEMHRRRRRARDAQREGAVRSRAGLGGFR